MIGVVLAGGENRRIPVLKGFLEIDGITIMERSADLLKGVLDGVVISSNMPERYFRFGFPLVGDVLSERGPMTGIFSSFISTRSTALFVAACDMPFIKEGLVRRIRDIYDNSPAGQFDAVIPVFGGRVQPLLGIYTDKVVRVIEEMIREGHRSLTEMLSVLQVRYVSDGEIEGVDPGGQSFVNINTLDDYERIGGKSCLV